MNLGHLSGLLVLPLLLCVSPCFAELVECQGIWTNKPCSKEKATGSIRLTVFELDDYRYTGELIRVVAAGLPASEELRRVAVRIVEKCSSRSADLDACVGDARTFLSTKGVAAAKELYSKVLTIRAANSWASAAAEWGAPFPIDSIVNHCGKTAVSANQCDVYAQGIIRDGRAAISKRQSEVAHQQAVLGEQIAARKQQDESVRLQQRALEEASRTRELTEQMVIDQQRILSEQQETTRSLRGY